MNSPLPLPDVLSRPGHTTSSLYLAMAAGSFQRPLKRGGRSLWVESEVQSVIDKEIATLPRMSAQGARPRISREVAA